VAVTPTGEAWSVPNSTEGMHRLVEKLGGMSPRLIVLEATGGRLTSLTVIERRNLGREAIIHRK
jgi:hypothetical protein